MINPVSWFEIYVDDIERAKTFYEAVFNTTLEPMKDPDVMKGLQMYMFNGDMEQYGVTGAICKMEHVKAGGNSTLVYFACEDCAVESGRVNDNGGELVQEKFSIGEHGWIAIAADTEGNMIGFHSMK